MATNFPSSLDSFTNPSASDAMDSVTVPHATQHANLNDAVEALEAKVGVDGSAVTSSLDYKVGITNSVTALMNSTTTCANVTSTAFEFSSSSMVLADDLNWHSTTTNPSRIVVDRAGVYWCFGMCEYNYNGTAANFFLSIRKNGGIMVDGSAYGGYFPSCTVGATFTCNAGDYIELFMYHQAGGTYGTLGNRNAFSVQLVREA